MVSQYKTDVILHTKILPPRVKKGSLHRTALVKTLIHNLDKRLIIIVAGAGYGKSTLLSQLMATTHMPVAYYLLEKSDRELAVFFSYIIAGIRVHHRTFGKNTEQLLRSREAQGFTPEMVARVFINEFVDTVKDDCVVMLDDFQNVQYSKAIVQALSYILEHALPTLHIVIASRQLPSLALSHLKAQNELYELSSSDLKFIAKEIKQLFSNLGLESLSEDDIQTIARYSEGWITSLQLMLHASKGDIKRLFSSHDVLHTMKRYPAWQQEYFDYFAQEIFEEESSGVQRFLVNCAVLEVLDRAACNAVTRQQKAGVILRNLEKKNVFLFKLSDTTYRFHNLFRDFLHSKLIDARWKKTLYLRAARYFHEHGQREMSVNYYLKTGNYKQVISIIRAIGYDMIREGKSETLCSYIDSMPVALVSCDPGLLMVYGYALLMRGYPQEAISNFTRAIRLYRKSKKVKRKLADAYYNMGSVYFNLGKFISAKKWLSKALRIYPKKNDLSKAGLYNSLGTLNYRMGPKRYRDAMKYYKKALKIVKKLKHKAALEASIINNWAMVERRMGNIKSALDKFLRAIRLLIETKAISPQFGIIFCNAARHHLYLGEVDKAKEVLQSGLSLSKKYNDMISTAAVLRGYGNYHEETHDLHRALKFFEQAMELIDRYGIKRLALPLHQDLCRVHAKLNRIVEAEQSLAAAYRLQKKMCSSEGIYTMHVAAILKKQQKNSTQARDIFTKALSCARKLRQPFEEFMLFLELGMLKYEMGKKVDASSFLHQAVVLSRTYGYGYQLFKTAAQDIDIADDLLGLDRQYVLSLFRTSCVPYHLIEVHLCGTPRIMIDGIVIPTEWWKTIKALKLMCFLCMSTGKELSRETIIDALWKTAPLDRSARSFRKAVHFVRQCFQRALTVQRNPIVYKDDTYCIDEHFIVHSDFESMVGLLDEVNAQCDYTCIKENIKHVLTLSEKGIASNWFEDWIEDLRTQCSKLLEEKLVYAADQAQEEGDLKNSNNWLNVLINMNFYEEEYHWKLWKNYAALGRYNDIKKNYIELKHRIKKEFNLDLQPQTEKYYQRLLAASSTRM